MCMFFLRSVDLQKKIDLMILQNTEKNVGCVASKLVPGAVLSWASQSGPLYGPHNFTVGYMALDF